MTLESVLERDGIDLERKDTLPGRTNKDRVARIIAAAREAESAWIEQLTAAESEARRQQKRVIELLDENSRLKSALRVYRLKDEMPQTLTTAEQAAIEAVAD